MNCLNEHWNELVQSTIKVKNQLLNNLNGNIASEVVEQLKLWITEIHNAYDTHPIRNASSAADLQLLKNELWVSKFFFSPKNPKNVDNFSALFVCVCR